MKSTMPKGILLYLVGVGAVCAIITVAAVSSARSAIVPPESQEWMAIKLTDTDLAKLQTLTRKGDTYTRYAKSDGTWGITAVRQSGGIWVVPCQEVGPVGGGK